MPQNKIWRVVAHITGWLLLLGLLIGFVSASHHRDGAVGMPHIRPSLVLFVAIWAVAFYFNAQVLIPKLYLRRHYIAYFGILLLLLAAVYWLWPFDNLVIEQRPRPNLQREMPMPPHTGMRPHRPPPFNNRPHTDIISIILLVMVLSLSFGLQIIRQWRLTEQRAALAEAENARAELNLLKAQINPHFLFNTLNNIYAMAVTANEHTAASIMKLSQIMRYLTETAQQEAVPLESAATCITDYIDLQQLRLNKQTTIDYTVSGNMQGLFVSPLILLPFVENVFKYGISSHEPSPVTIRLEAAVNGIRFFCQNRIFEHSQPPESTGIGIDNTRRRLAFLYPDKHQLHISTDNGLFTVQLEVQL